MKFQIDFSGQFRWSSLHRAIPAVPFSAHAALSTRSRSRMLKWRIQSSEPESTQKLLRPDDCCRTENRIWNAIVNSMKYIQAKSCCISRYCSEISVWQAYFHSHLYPQMAQRIDIPYLKRSEFLDDISQDLRKITSPVIVNVSKRRTFVKWIGLSPGLKLWL